jgi:hypothetical protein
VKRINDLTDFEDELEDVTEPSTTTIINGLFRNLSFPNK